MKANTTTLCLMAICLVIAIHADTLQPGGDDPTPKSLQKLRELVNGQLDSSMKDGLKLDVAVIGAGMSGLYTAWRLGDEEAGANRKQVQIFELSSRIGGRLHSVILPGMTIAAELGGMRYLNSQKIVTALIEQIFKSQLQNTPFEMGNENGKGRLFYGRGQRCPQNAWIDGQKSGKLFKTRYTVGSKVFGFNAYQMFNKVIADVLLADPWFSKEYKGKVVEQDKFNYAINLSIKEWDDIKPKLFYNFEGPYNGMKVNLLGFWNVIKDQLGQEAYEFLSDAGGYYSSTGDSNAAESFAKMVLEFSSPDIKYKTIDGGYDQIAYAIAEKYKQQDDSKIWIKNPLESFEKEPEGSEYRYKLIIRNIDADQTWTVYANAIVLAMPPRSLELLNQNNFFFKPSENKEIQKSMASVAKQPAFKLLMGFENAWWGKEYGPGRSVTDLPIRQCFYFGKSSNSSHALFMASYNDMRTVSFWEPLEPHETRESFSPTGTSHVHKDELIPFHSVQATTSMVEEAMNQIREMHGMTKEQMPNPYVTWFKDWSEDPFGGGYHFWNAGVDVGAVMHYMRKPIDTEAIHICGEAFSGEQGWVEGALGVTENMLEEHFNLTRPAWLDEQYYLRW